MKEENYSGFQSTRAMIVEKMIAISLGLLNDMQHHILNNMEKFLVFFRQPSSSISYFPGKSSDIITLVNADSWLITEYHFHPILHTLSLFFFNQLCPLFLLPVC